MPLPLPLRAGAQDHQPDLEIDTAPVEVDGQVLFRVCAASSMPADARTARVSNRIEAAAADPMKIGNVIGEVTEFRIQVTRLKSLMTPLYIADPPEPKVVPPAQWYAAPAAPPKGTKAAG